MTWRLLIVPFSLSAILPTFAYADISVPEYERYVCGNAQYVLLTEKHADDHGSEFDAPERNIIKLREMRFVDGKPSYRYIDTMILDMVGSDFSLDGARIRCVDETLKVRLFSKSNATEDVIGTKDGHILRDAVTGFDDQVGD